MARCSAVLRYKRPARRLAAIRPKDVVVGASGKQLDLERGGSRTVTAPNLEGAASVRRGPAQMEGGRFGTSVRLDLESMHNDSSIPGRSSCFTMGLRRFIAIQAPYGNETVALVKCQCGGRFRNCFPFEATIGMRSQHLARTMAGNQGAGTSIEAL